MRRPILPFCLLVLAGTLQAMDSNSNQITLSPAEQLQSKLDRYFQHVVNTPADSVENEQIRNFWNSASHMPLHSKEHCFDCLNGLSQNCFASAMSTKYILADQWIHYCEQNNHVVPRDILNFAMHYTVKQQMSELKKTAGCPQNLGD